MRQQLILFCLTFLSFTGISQDWIKVEQFFPAQTFQDMIVLNDQIIYGSTATYGGSDQQIKYSEDAGATWQFQQTGFADMPMRAIASPDNVQVFAIGNDGILIHNTGDGIWNQIELGTLLPLRCIDFVDENIGYIGSDDAELYKTIDGGLNWNNINPNLDGVGTISELHFIDENVGLTCGFNYMQRTLDGGLNWDYVVGFTPNDGPFQLVCFHFIDDTTGFVGGDGGVLYKTEDAGITWTLLESGIERSIRSIHFVNDQIGFACAFNGEVIQTFDGGMNWQEMSSESTEHCRAMGFVGDVGFIGTQIGELLKFDLSTSTEEVYNISISTLGPNPTADVLNVASDLLFKYYAIYNQQGSLIKKGSIENSIIPVKDLLSGMYFARLMLATESVTHRFIKL